MITHLGFSNITVKCDTDGKFCCGILWLALHQTKQSSPKVVREVILHMISRIKDV